MINNISQSTQTGMTTPIDEILRISDLLSDYSSFILIGGIALIIILFILVIIIVAVVTCCIMKRFVIKHTTAPKQRTDSMLFELPARANEIFNQSATINPAYIPEKEDKIELGMDNISLSNYSNQYDI